MIQNATPTPPRSEIFASYGPALEAALARNVHDAIDEDVGTGDPTARLADPEARRIAQVICRERAILCGADWFNACMAAIDPDIQVEWFAADGDWMQPSASICRIEGLARSILTAERSALNFIQTLSGAATSAARYAALAEGTQAKILDTRKTIPGLRLAQKYATRVGGGANQRLALYDGILIKENHIASCGGVSAVLEKAQALQAGVGIQIEVETIAQLREALAHGAESILLDNFDLKGLAEAVSINQAHDRPALLEASGGVDEGSLRAIAQTGVDRISVGMITKRVTPVDFSMRVIG